MKTCFNNEHFQLGCNIVIYLYGSEVKLELIFNIVWWLRMFGHKGQLLGGRGDEDGRDWNDFFNELIWKKGFSFSLTLTNNN